MHDSLCVYMYEIAKKVRKEKKGMALATNSQPKMTWLHK